MCFRSGALRVISVGFVEIALFIEIVLFVGIALFESSA